MIRNGIFSDPDLFFSMMPIKDPHPHHCISFYRKICQLLVELNELIKERISIFGMNAGVYKFALWGRISSFDEMKGCQFLCLKTIIYFLLFTPFGKICDNLLIIKGRIGKFSLDGVKIYYFTKGRLQG